MHAVYESGHLTLDSEEVAPGVAVQLQHVAFRLSEAEFDALLARLQALGVAWRIAMRVRRNPVRVSVQTYRQRCESNRYGSSDGLSRGFAGLSRGP